MSGHPPCLLKQINESILVYPMTSSETVRDLYRAMRDKDDAVVYGLCSADIIWHHSEGFLDGSTRQSPASVIENVFRTNAKHWTRFAFAENKFIATTERLVGFCSKPMLTKTRLV
jgi:ketosteroid isomerase-like protein